MIKRLISAVLILLFLVGCSSGPKMTKEELFENMLSAEQELRSVQMDMELKEKNETNKNTGRYLDSNQYIYDDKLNATTASYQFTDEANPENSSQSYYSDGFVWFRAGENPWEKQESANAKLHGDYFDMLYFTMNNIAESLTLKNMTLYAKGTDFGLLDELIGYSLVNVSDSYRATDYEYQVTINPKSFFIEKVEFRINYDDPGNDKNFINHVVTKKFSKFNEIDSIERPAGAE